MIVGSGNIASILRDRDWALFFASGVSDSGCTDKEQFKRETELLMNCAIRYQNYSCFYFSSISINFIDTPYTRHKKNMEDMVKTRFTHCNIIRIGNISWDTNPNTFVNYIKDRQARGLSVDIKDEYRYMIDKETLLLLTNSLPLTGKNEITATSSIKKVREYL